MKHFLKSRLSLFLFRLLQAILFAIPLIVFLVVNRKTFFVEQSGYGIAGLGILGIIIWALCLAKVFGKLPKIIYFVILFFAFFCLDMLSAFLKDIGAVVLIGAVLALPLNPIIHAINIDGEVDLKERSRQKALKRIKKEKVVVEVGE